MWQEPFGARAGSQDHRAVRRAPARRPRAAPRGAGLDAVLAIGAPVFRQYPFAPGRCCARAPAPRVLTDDPGEAHRSPVDVAVIGDLPSTCAALADASRRGPRAPREPPAAPEPPDANGPLRAGHVLAALAERLPPETVVVEEPPRAARAARPAARAPPARLPQRGDGRPRLRAAGRGGAADGAARRARGGGDRRRLRMFAIQGLWSAARYRTGALFVVLANDGYAVMDRLAERTGGARPWPGFGDRHRRHGPRPRAAARTGSSAATSCTAALDEVVPGLGRPRGTAALLEVVAEPDVFSP